MEDSYLVKQASLNESVNVQFVKCTEIYTAINAITELGERETDYRTAASRITHACRHAWMQACMHACMHL